MMPSCRKCIIVGDTAIYNSGPNLYAVLSARRHFHKLLLNSAHVNCVTGDRPGQFHHDRCGSDTRPEIVILVCLSNVIMKRATIYTLPHDLGVKDSWAMDVFFGNWEAEED